MGLVQMATAKASGSRSRIFTKEDNTFIRTLVNNILCCIYVKSIYRQRCEKKNPEYVANDKTQTSLCIRAVLSAPLLIAYW